MKQYAVKMKVHHGDYLHEETATATKIEDAIKQILKTPMGVGYGPSVGSIQYGWLCYELWQNSLNTVPGKPAKTGKAQMGWADYSAKQIEEAD